MPAPKVRADYEALKQVAANFGAQVSAARQSLQQLQRQADVLSGGDWVGKGASAFHQEMSGVVLPVFRRLADALEAAQRTTVQVSQIMQQAEAEAARVLRGEGDTAATAGGAGGAGRLGGSVAVWG